MLPRTYGPKTGRCNICGETGPLTDDHTPPKGCLKPTQVEIHHVLERMKVGERDRRGRLSQNGVKYRTLCAGCNSGLLGTESDPELISFANSIAHTLISDLILPSVISLKQKPQRLMRSVLGHITAQGIDRFGKGPIAAEVSEYLLDANRSLPRTFHVYCWVFPYKDFVLARDCAFLDTTKEGPCLMWLLKYFPVAFLVALEKPTEYSFPGTELSMWRNCKIDDEKIVRLDLTERVHRYWPELPTSTSAIIYGEDAITSFDYKRNAS